MDIISIIILASVCMAIGAIGASMVHNLRAKEPENTPAEMPPDTRAEILRLWQKKENGRMLPEMDGQLIQSASELSAEQHANLNMALVDLYQWLEDGSMPTPQLKPAPPKNSPASKEKQVTGEGDPPGTADPEVPDQPPDSDTGDASEQDAAEDNVEPASINVFRSLIKTARSEIKNKIETEPQSIATQVDEILQKKIEGTPLVDRGVRIMDIPSKGMAIYIGLEKYEVIDEIPDDEIKEIIKASVAEWEAGMMKKKR